ncbi:C45 family autoproteolytic acyltransferase/hydolase [Natrinema salaciae]|uniref:Acyl-coenzyme A:6-aminopenicillanic acid acyl-transferase n=1 Tax=Natrinema salaciae TaxID=1186196 RepID=A0A1H9JFN0_9EURY|nr:C45 family peptidase [Natrinema salaciae]SEQ85579.1 Acyl-coenzyme A:6-aminopenicillanic acid acyl-transferase [Natrinema salaciae]
MDEPDLERTAFTGPNATSEPDSYAEQARRRAETEREAVEWAVDELASMIADASVDLEPLLEYARRSRESMPDRHVRAYEAMAGTLDVDTAVYDVYAFAYSDLCDELADEPAADPSRGCTNVLVSPPRAAGDAPLVLKNRDIAGRGVRPKSVVEQPAIGDFHGFLTVDTCGTVMLYKGVNDRGLVAANTYIDANRDDLEPEDQLRNGTVVRRLLEECATVAAARSLLESLPARRLMAQTLFLADGTDAALLEVNPLAERLVVDDADAVTRTNHFVLSRSDETESSRRRRERATTLLEAETELDRGTLWRIARDHEHGPGDESICRHPEPDTDDYAVGQLTTASAAVFDGGSPTVEVVVGNPCETEPTQCAFGDELPMALRTGARWLERLR